MNDPDAAYERFSLLFEAGAGVLLQDGICRFEHPELGLFDLFIQRVGPPGKATVCYQAVFNRPAPVVSSSTRTLSIG